VAGVTDLRRLDTLVMVDSQSVSIDLSPEMSLSGRIALAASPNTERLPVITGNSMNEEAAGNRAVLELVRFFRGAPFGLNYYDLSAEEGSAALIIDTLDPAQNMIIWEFNMYDPAGNTVAVTIDDETGVIVRLVYILGDRGGALLDKGRYDTSDIQFFNAAQSLTAIMSEYYGIRVELSDYQFSGNLSYYRADIDNGDLIISMFGVVRASSFTMNERLY